MFQKVMFLSLQFLVFGLICASDSLDTIESDKIPQIATSEVFYRDNTINEEFEDSRMTESENIQEQKNVPVWPMKGTDADMAVSCDTHDCSKNNNVSVESKIGEGVTITNNFDMKGLGWSGGPSIIHQNNGFYNECEDNTKMPLLKQEMMEDDGGEILTVSRSNNRRCNEKSKKFIKENLLSDDIKEKNKEEKKYVVEYNQQKQNVYVRDQIRSWVVANGQSLRDVLQDWCNKEGWDLVWGTSREYPIEASAVFKGRFVDVASALIRNFSRANPIPYAKFYKGNRVLLISTTEE